MFILNILRDLDRKFSWSFFGFLLAIVFGATTLYDRFLADKRPQLYLDVLTSAAVLDIREDLPKLDILFDGINIREQNLSLRIVSVKVVNDSSQDILRGHYDPDDPVGLQIYPGKIIRVEIAESSNDYLTRNLSFSSPTDNTAHFKDVILEAHQYFVLKLLILHPANQTSLIKPLGHIAGMKNIFVREPYRQLETVSFWARVFAGSWGIQLLRLVTYFVLAILTTLLIAIPSSFLSEKVDGLRRKRAVREFKVMTSLPLNESDEYLFTSYVTGGQRLILSMQNLAESQTAIDNAVARYLEYWNKLQQATDADADLWRREFLRHFFDPAHLMDDFVEAGFVKIQEGSGTVDQHMKETLNHFLRFLKNKRLIPFEGSAPVFPPPEGRKHSGNPVSDDKSNALALPGQETEHQTELHR